MKITSRILALLLAACMLVALCACGASSEASSAPAQSAEAPASEPEAAPAAPDAAPADEAASAAEASAVEEIPEEPEIVINYPLFDDVQTYTIWLGTAPDLSEVVSSMDQFVIFRELKDITNVDWDAKMVSFMAEAEQFQLMVAAGEYTDVVVKAVDNYSGTVDQAIEEDFLIDVRPYIADNMPNLTKWFQKYPELERMLCTDAGAIGAFPKIYKEPSDISSGGAIRQDWLDDLGLDNPKTFDDLHDTLKAFQEKKGAAMPLVISVDTGVQGELISGYNIAAGYYQVDGEIRYGGIQPEFKDYLTMMHDWYAEGLVDDLFLSQGYYTSLMDWSPILTGSCGVWYGTAAQSFTNLLDSAEDPNIRINGLCVTTDGETAHVGEAGAVFDSQMWSITTVCEDPEVICQYVDYVYSDDGVMLANYGIEGETFTYVDGTPRLTDLVLNNPDYSYGAAMNIFVCDRMTPAPFVIDEDRVRADYVEDQINAIEVWNNSNDGLYNLPKSGISLTVDESEEYNSLYTDIETYMDENIAKFIVGDKSLDEFDAYVDTLIDMGIEDCVALEQAAYDRYLSN